MEFNQTPKYSYREQRNARTLGYIQNEKLEGEVLIFVLFFLFSFPLISGVCLLMCTHVCMHSCTHVGARDPCGASSSIT